MSFYPKKDNISGLLRKGIQVSHDFWGAHGEHLFFENGNLRDHDEGIRAYDEKQN